MNRPQFERSLLPAPVTYLRANGLLTGKPSAWVSIPCPAHKNGTEAHPSLRVCLEDGHFRCMTCGVKGGDLVALHMLRTGCGFLDAARQLGAVR